MFGLTDEEKNLLYHTYPRNTQPRWQKKIYISLINDLVGLVLLYRETRGNTEVKLHVTNPEVYTGIGSPKRIQQILTRINELWQKNGLATIRYEGGYIYFELFSNEMAA